MKKHLLLYASATLLLLSATGWQGRPPARRPAAKRPVAKVSPKAATQRDSTLRLDRATGLVVAPGFELVKANCTACHSSKIILQTRADRAGWLEKIRWMQAKQKLWDLGEMEAPILDYLAKHYPPTAHAARRQPLGPLKWYVLDAKPNH